MSNVYERYIQYKEINKEVFERITSHHKEVAASGSWDEAIGNETNLEKYSDAATKMGEKQWVKSGNHWMENRIIDYFRNGGKQRSIARSLRRNMSTEEDSIIDMEDTDSIPEKIRLVDVGSCYNPFTSSPSSHLFSVIALDLFPADKSVYKCDFLSLIISDASIREESIVIIGDKKRKREEESIVTAVDKSDQTLTSLPATSAEAVTFSLVLSYLPDPQQRLAMVRFITSDNDIDIYLVW